MNAQLRLEKQLRILKKERADICIEMDLEYEVIKCKLMDCYKTKKDFKRVIKRIKLKKKFKKALAKALGVKYSTLRDQLPRRLNSTLIANFLDPHLDHLSHQEIRRICQKVKMDFDDFL
jgi:hypothetical protein